LRVLFGPVSSTSDAKPGAPVRSPIIPAEFVPDRAGTVGFLGNQTRKGDWILPRLFRAVSVLGSVTIDLTHARVGPGTSRIEVRAVLGNVEIIVPPELRVECDGSALLANFEADTKAQAPLPPDAPLISVGGSAFFANVEVRVVDPNAPDWIDRLTSRLKK
jgi:cell wall-active antibiotic response 4TMS protein YvqF